MLSPFLLSALEELTQGLGRGKFFSKYPMQDLENCCSVGFLLSGAQMDLFPGSTFQMIQQEVHCILLSIPNGCVSYTSTAWWCLALQQTSSAFLRGLLFTVTWLGFALEVPAEALAPACPYSSCSNAASLSMSSFNWTSAVILLKLMAHSGLNFS